MQYSPKLRKELFFIMISFRLFTVSTFIVQYIVPLSVVLLCYTFIIHDVAFVRRSSYVHTGTLAENRNLIKLILVITTTFALCVLPYHLVALLVEFEVEFDYMDDVSLGAYLLLYTNSALNPIMYNVCSSSFREEFTKAYKKFCRTLKWRGARGDGGGTGGGGRGGGDGGGDTRDPRGGAVVVETTVCMDIGMSPQQTFV